MHRRCILLALLLLSLPLRALAASHLNLGGTAPTQQCDHLTMAADTADCDNSRCHLDGHAQIRCDNLTLWADAIDLLMTPDRQFNGAVATGNALLVEGIKVMRCKQITVQPDHVRAFVDTATLEVRRNNVPADPNGGVPPGRNQAVMHGNIERLDQDHILLHQADFTLCDCGADATPSWRFDGHEIEATLGERVTIWWPQVRINAFGLGLVPITPPLAPLSLPLTHRATGFLIPEPQFLGGAWPTIDLPYFFPLGESWDLKVAPGLRMDWGTHRGLSMHALGAPRLGVRLRYAPTESTTGVFNAQITRDGAHGMAERILTNDRIAGVDVTTPIYLAMDAQRRSLVNRVSLDWKHRTHLQEGLDWVVDARWISDDLVNSDFLLAIDERLASYLSSRTELAWRSAAGGAWLGGDFMLRLDSTAPSPFGIPLPVYSNVGGAELGTVHRGPFLLLQSLPVPLWEGLAVDGGLSLVRYGTLTGAPPHDSPNPADPKVATQLMLGGTAGLSFNRSLGPINFAARGGADSVLVSTAEGRHFFDTALLAGADADLRLAGRHGDTLHIIAPRLVYRALAARWSSTPDMDTTIASNLDERLKRRISHQVMAVLHQSLWQGAPQTTPVGSLDIGQPIDLMTGAMLQPWAELSWRALEAGTGSLWTSLDPRNLAKVPELAATWAYTHPYFTFSAGYERFSPDADRFQRSMYQLAAPRQPPPPPPPPAIPGMPVDSAWSHSARAGLTLRWGKVFDVSYGTVVQLPRPGQVGGEPACLTTQELAQSPRPLAPRACVTQHSVALSYSSPCDCWGINALFSAVPQDIPNSLRFQIFFNVAGFRLGSPASTR